VDGRRGGNRRAMSEFNITPFVDVDAGAFDPSSCRGALMTVGLPFELQSGGHVVPG